MRRYAWVLVLCSALAARPAGASVEVTLTVSVASSLSDAFRDLKALYRKAHPEIGLALNLGASGVLQVQIERGAPADLFVPAGMQPMQALVDGGLVDSSEVRAFVRNRLVLIAPSDRAPSALTGPRELAGFIEGARRIALGDEKTVPAGRYAAQVLRKMGLYEKVKGKLVPATDVRQVLQYVASGAADAGFVYATDVLRSASDARDRDGADGGSKDVERGSDAADRVSIVAEMPADSHDPIIYPVAPIRASEHPREAREFLRFLLGADARAILRSHGFELPRADGSAP